MDEGTDVRARGSDSGWPSADLEADAARDSLWIPDPM